MDRRAAFFLVASAACGLLTPVADPDHRPVAVGLSVLYALLALASWLDARAKARSG